MKTSTNFKEKLKSNTTNVTNDGSLGLPITGISTKLGSNSLYFTGKTVNYDIENLYFVKTTNPDANFSYQVSLDSSQSSLRGYVEAPIKLGDTIYLQAEDGILFYAQDNENEVTTSRGTVTVTSRDPRHQS